MLVREKEHIARMTESDHKMLLGILLIALIACLLLDAYSRHVPVCEGTPSVDHHIGHFPGTLPKD
jgi:hypothetical protein